MNKKAPMKGLEGVERGIMAEMVGGERDLGCFLLLEI